MIIGAVAGVLVVYSVEFWDRRHIDDPCGAISVHGVNGAWGVLAVGLFADGTYGQGWNGAIGVTAHHGVQGPLLRRRRPARRAGVPRRGRLRLGVGHHVGDLRRREAVHPDPRVARGRDPRSSTCRSSACSLPRLRAHVDARRRPRKCDRSTSSTTRRFRIREDLMKLVTALVKPFKLDEVKEALTTLGLAGHHDHRSQGLRPPTRTHRGVPRRRVHGGVRAQGAHRGADRRRRRPRVADTIVDAARTGQIGDGKVWISPVDTIIRVRTGEMDHDAI